MLPFLCGCAISEYGLIHDRRDYNKELKGKEKLQEAIKQLKEMNPDLDSIYIRLGDEEQ